MHVAVVSSSCTVDVNQGTLVELERLGHTVTLITPNRWVHLLDSAPIRPRRLAGFSGRMIGLPVVRAGSVPLHGYRARLRPLLAALRPDVLHLDEEPYSVSAAQWAWAARRTGVPGVFSTLQNLVKRYPLPFRVSERSVWSWAHGAVCITPAVVEALRGRGFRSSTWVVPLAVDLDAFQPAAGDRERAAELALRPNVIGYLGRLVPEKGITVLLDAYRRLPGDLRSSTTLLMLGDGPLAGACRSVDGVVVRGLTHGEVPGWLPLADFVCLPSLTTPSWKEQFGRAMIEAMACERPVIGSSSGEIPAIIGATGGGVVVPEGDAAALATALERLLRDPGERRRLGAAGRAAVLGRYSNRSRASTLSEIFLSAAAGNGAGAR